MPKLFDYKSFVDDRGTFINIPLNYPEVNFEGKRTYICSNFKEGTVRGFYYHNKEQKIFICLKGAVKFVLLKGAKSEVTAKTAKPEVFVLSENIPKALYIPNDYANAWQTLTNDTILIGISSVTVEESINDDIRFNPEIVAPLWRVVWR